MDGWGRRKGDNYCNQESTRTRSYNRKPPLGSWQPTVPSWEKKFCTSIGSVPWRQILETKKCMHLYDNVVKWNDSAGEEAFHNAKSRFYAKIHGLPCDLSLPDSEIYIDKIDWDSKIDPELILDLEREPLVLDADQINANVVIFGDFLLNQGYSSFGWGESDEHFKKAANSSSGNNDNPWECKYGQSDGAVKGNGWEDVGNNSWNWDESNGATGDSGWGYGWNHGCGDGWNDSSGWDQFENNNYGSEAAKDRSADGVSGTDVNNGKRGSSGRYMSRCKTSRVRGDDHQRNHSGSSWRNGNARKGVNVVLEQQMSDKRAQWNFMNSCAPVNHHASGKHQHLIPVSEMLK